MNDSMQIERCESRQCHYIKKNRANMVETSNILIKLGGEYDRWFAVANK